jgi:voltage-gated potassium channel
MDATPQTPGGLRDERLREPSDPAGQPLMRKKNLREWLHDLYFGTSTRSRKFRIGLFVFDLVAVIFFAFSSIAREAPLIILIDWLLAIPITLDFSARYYLATNKRRFLLTPATWADIVVIATLFLASIMENLLFLRALRLLRSYRVLSHLKRDYRFFKKNEDLIRSVTNLCVFLFVTTSFVYVLQVRVNPEINTYLDALYFTISTMSTTGFGDITLVGPMGKLLSIIIMLSGVTLFLRLLQSIFRPNKVTHECPDCGLQRHEVDAVHCKHCGRVLHIVDEGTA